MEIIDNQSTTKSANRNLEYDKVYMAMAKNVSTLSYAVKAQVGCIIVSPSGQVISHGWNGMPKGFDNCCEYTDEAGHLKTKPEVIHAESNAILKCARIGSSTCGSTLYVTLSPCIDCAKLILQAGVKRVVFLDKYKSDHGIKFLYMSNVIVQQLVDGELINPFVH